MYEIGTPYFLNTSVCDVFISCCASPGFCIIQTAGITSLFLTYLWHLPAFSKCGGLSVAQTLAGILIHKAVILIIHNGYFTISQLLLSSLISYNAHKSNDHWISFRYEEWFIGKDVHVMWSSLVEDEKSDILKIYNSSNTWEIYDSRNQYTQI